MLEISPESERALATLLNELGPASDALKGISTNAASAASALSGINVNPLIAASRLAAKEATASATATKMLTRSFVDASKAMMSTQQGTGKYAGAVDEAATAIKLFGNALGPLGKAVTWVASTFVSMAANSLKQNDALLKTYQTMSKFGTIDSQSFEKLMDDAHKAGYGMENIGVFADNINSVSEDLAMFSKSAAAGKDKMLASFNGIAGPASELRETLVRYGYSQDEALEKMTSFASTIALSGGLQKRTTAELTRESFNYLKTLTELSELTGENRDEVAKRIRAQKEDLAWQIYLGKLEREGKHAEADGLRVFAAQADRFGTDIGTGMRQFMRTGVLMSEEAAIAQRMVGQKQLQDARALAHRQYGDSEEGRRKMNGDMTDILHNMGSGANRAMAQFESVSTYGDAAMQKSVGLSVQLLEGAALWSDKTSKTYADNVAELEKRITGDRLGNENARAQSEMKVRNAQENLTFQIGKLAVPAVTKFSQVMEYVTSKLAKLLKGITLGFVDVTKEFRDSSEIMKENNELMEEYRDNQKEAARIEERLRNPKISSFERQMQTQRLENLSSRRSAIASQISTNEAERGSMAGGLGEASAMTSQLEEDKILKFSGDSGGSSAFHELDKDFQQRVLKAASAYYETNKKPLTISSAYRSEAEQERIYRLWLDAGGGPNKPKAGGYYMPAKPKSMGGPGSNHTNRRAVDILEQDKAALDALEKAGLNRPLGAKDPVHWSAATGGIFKGPRSGYTVELHGHEAVVPMSVFSNFFKNQGPDTSSNVGKTALSTALPQLTSPSSSNGEIVRVISEMIEVMTDKFDNMIDQQRRLHDVNEQLLTHAKH